MKSMEITRAACIWITPDDDTRRVFEATMAAYRKTYETYAHASIENKTTSRYRLHELAYRKTRALAPDLPASLNQAARDWASTDIKAYNTMHPKRKFKKVPSSGGMRSMAYTLSVSSLRGNLLTFSTVKDRRRFLIEIPDHFIKRWLEPALSWKYNAATVTLTKKGKLKVCLTFRIHFPDTPRIEGEVLGVDRGLYNIVATSDGELYKGNRIRATRRKYAHARKTCQKKEDMSEERHPQCKEKAESHLGAGRAVSKRHKPLHIEGACKQTRDIHNSPRGLVLDPQSEQEGEKRQEVTYMALRLGLS